MRRCIETVGRRHRMLQQYFDRSGRRLRRDQAVDENGTLRDGVILRTAMAAMDAAPRGMPRFTDDFQLNRPGWRGSASSSESLFGDQQTAKHDAYKSYNDTLTNAWRKPAWADARSALSTPCP